LRGHSIQGIDHIFTTLDGLISGRINGRGWPKVRRRTASTVHVDGGGGLGQVAGVVASKHITVLARQAGCAAAAVVNADDLFMLGYYVECIARNGLVGVAMISTCPPRVHSPEGLDPVLGTNPIAVAVPLERDDVFVFDCAPASMAVGKVRIASYSGAMLPDGAAIDEHGQPTTDPHRALAGSLSPSGAAGFGLGLCVALIGGALTGGVLGSELDKTMDGSAGVGGRGNLFLAIDPNAFCGRSLGASSAAYLKQLESQLELAPGGSFHVPGRRSAQARAVALVEGVAIDAVSWSRAAAYAERLGVRAPATRPV
jgi:LDH2 family malate/lactate/ureidoglycolate dehydrogenase